MGSGAVSWQWAGRLTPGGSWPAVKNFKLACFQAKPGQVKVFGAPGQRPGSGLAGPLPSNGQPAAKNLKLVGFGAKPHQVKVFQCPGEPPDTGLDRPLSAAAPSEWVGRFAPGGGQPVAKNLNLVGFWGKPCGVKVFWGLGQCTGSGLDGSLPAAASQQ